MTQIPPQQPFGQQPFGQQPFGQQPVGQPAYGQAQGTPGAPGGGYSMPPQRKTSGAAIAALIFGILGCVPLITGLIAIVCGFIGIRTTRDPRYSGRGMAVAGLILGLLSVLIWGVVGGTAGWGGWWAYNQTKPQREASRQLATDLSAGNVDAAMARCTSQVKREELVAAAAKMKGWGTLQDTTMPIGSRQTVNSVEEAYVAGAATFSGAGGVPYIVGFKTEGGSPKVTGFLLTGPNGAVTAGMDPNQSRAKPKVKMDE
jgi:hypothetical protein